MKNLKKFGALLLALVMILSLSLTAFAADGDTATSYTITIDNPVEGETYSAYKIFDATHTTVGEGNAAKTLVSYTIKESDAWFNTVMNFMGFTYDTTSSKWQSGTPASDATAPYSGKGLTLTPSADGSRYVVSVVTNATEEGAVNFSAADFAAYLISNKPATVSADGYTTPEKTDTGWSTDSNKGDTITVTAPGYYLIDTTLGALCALDTTTPTVTIYEKNSEPTIDKQVFNPASDKVATNTYTLDGTENTGNGAWKDVKTTDTHNEEPATVDVCQTVYYQLVVNTGSDAYEDTATGVDADYVIVDTLPAGFTYTADSIAIVDEDHKDTTDNTKPAAWTSDTDYTIDTTTTTGKIVITLKYTGKLGGLEENKNITITYAATMTNSAVAIGMNGQTTDGTNTAANTNTVTLTYQKKDGEGVSRGTDEATVYTYQIGGTKEDGTTPIIQKVDGTAKDDGTFTPLAGVKFVLSKTVGADDNKKTYYAKVSEKTATTAGSYYLTSWDTHTDTIPTGAETDKDYMIITGTDGDIEVLGLDAGTYTLTEVETLDGYNLMKGTITATIAETGEVTYTYNGDTANPEADTTTTTGTVTIKNYTGTELPSTGGTGTTIFYIVGGILVLGAAVLLITKRRMNAAK